MNGVVKKGKNSGKWELGIRNLQGSWELGIRNLRLSGVFHLTKLWLSGENTWQAQ